MGRNFWILIILVCFSSEGVGQSKNIVYEQEALNYFTDSIIGKKSIFVNRKVHFDGFVDSIITTITFQLTSSYPKDKELKEQYGITQSTESDFWIKNKKAAFELSVKPPIKKKKFKKRFKRKTKVVRMKIFQNKKVGLKNYVWIRTFFGRGYHGSDLYFVMDEIGTVIDWIEISFIF